MLCCVSQLYYTSLLAYVCTGIGDLDDFGSLPPEAKQVAGARTPSKQDKNHNQPPQQDKTPSSSHIQHGQDKKGPGEKNSRVSSL